MRSEKEKLREALSKKDEEIVDREMKISQIKSDAKNYQN